MNPSTEWYAAAFAVAFSVDKSVVAGLLARIRCERTNDSGTCPDARVVRTLMNARHGTDYDFDAITELSDTSGGLRITFDPAKVRIGELLALCEAWDAEFEGVVFLAPTGGYEVEVDAPFSEGKIARALAKALT